MVIVKYMTVADPLDHCEERDTIEASRQTNPFHDGIIVRHIFRATERY